MRQIVDDEDQFGKSLLRELPAVSRLARRLAPHPDWVDDLVQETCMRALQAGRSRNVEMAGVRSWLFTILQNVVYAKLGRGRREALLLDEFRRSNTLAGNSEAHTPAGAPQVDWEDLDQRLKSAIEELPAPLQSVFLLSAIEQLEYREIAVIAAIPLGTVMSRLHRARLLLSERLSEFGVEAGVCRRAISRSQRRLKREITIAIFSRMPAVPAALRRRIQQTMHAPDSNAP